MSRTWRLGSHTCPSSHHLFASLTSSQISVPSSLVSSASSYLPWLVKLQYLLLHMQDSKGIPWAGWWIGCTRWGPGGGVEEGPSWAHIHHDLQQGLVVAVTASAGRAMKCSFSYMPGNVPGRYRVLSVQVFIHFSWGSSNVGSGDWLSWSQRAQDVCPRVGERENKQWANWTSLYRTSGQREGEILLFKFSCDWGKLTTEI